MAEAAMSERPIPTGEGLTFEKVWAMFQESDRKMQETDRLMKENARRQRETDRQMKELGRRMGDLHNRFGEIAEHLVAPGIASRFNEMGHHFSGIAPNGYVIRDEQGKIKTEIDMLLENGKSIMAVEVKTRPRIQDIEHHVKRMEIIREHRNRYGDTRTIYGAIAGAVFGKQEKQTAIEAGFYVIEQSGDTMQITVPDGFVP